MNHEIRKRALSLLRTRLKDLDLSLEYEIGRAIDEAELSVLHDELDSHFDEYSRGVEERQKKIMDAFDGVQSALIDAMKV